MTEKTVYCPQCDQENEYDDDNDVVLCWFCDAMIYIDEEDE